MADLVIVRTKHALPGDIRLATAVHGRDKVPAGGHVRSPLVAK